MANTVEAATGVAKNRLTQVFKFLKSLNESRNPVPRDLSAYSQTFCIDEWPTHPTITIQRGDREDNDENTDVEVEMEPTIRIQRAQLTACPNPPSILNDWLMPTWRSVDDDVEVLESRNFVKQDEGTITVRFADDVARVQALNAWEAIRTTWAEAERPAVAARQLFERVHALWTTMQREGDRVELVLADGMLLEEKQLIRHPVLLQRINFEFDPAVPEFRFSTGTEKIELNRPLLRLVPTIEGRMIAFFDKELESHPVEPLGGEGTARFLRSLIQGLFTDGEFLDEKPGELVGHPTIWREPVMFLRPRIAGLSSTIDFILEDLEDNVVVPPGLEQIVGLDPEDKPPSQTQGDDRLSATPSASDPDILFSKPANREQYEIASRLATGKAVLVQGPPGTGKTHTIANLLGYLLAQGKTVLVTAHTTKALRVLRDQVDTALQPLCLSVLGRDSESQSQLKESAQEIANRLSSSNAATLRKEASLLREKRRKLRDAAAALRRQLRDARFSEFEEIVVGGEGLSPIEVARCVKAASDNDGWIPGPLQPGILCPLSESEVRHLYATHAVLSLSDERQTAVAQPSIGHLVSPSDFRLLTRERLGTTTRANFHRREFWGENPTTKYSATQLQELHQRVCAAAGLLAENENWLREVLFAGWAGGDHQEIWNDLLASIELLSAEAATATRLQKTHGPELPEDYPIDELASKLEEIVSHLDSGHSLGLMTKVRHRNWHELIGRCRVDGRGPQTIDEFRALREIAKLQQRRARFAGRWQRTVESLGGPSVESLGGSPERAAQGYAVEIRKRIDCRTVTWEPLISELRSVGFRWDEWLATHAPVAGDHGELARVRRAASEGLPEVVEAQAALIRQTELSKSLEGQRAYLVGFPESEAASVLLTAQDEWDDENYEVAYRELARLEGLRPAYGARIELLEKLQSAGAPSWALAILKREKPHDRDEPPGDAKSAWKWRQWHQELERRASVSITDLQERLEKTEKDLLEMAAGIIEQETWAAQCERTGLQARQALMGFVLTMRKIGKGTGKRVPELLRKARELLASARRAVPVWIMPLSRVYESFDPRETKFDVVIIDEASQSDVTSLAALYLGCEHVVVGDKEQVTPDAIGQRVDEVSRLISTDLQGIPNNHLYDGQTSIYDLAETAFGSVVALREHFRCVPEIIQFSNHLSYNNAIRPLREPFLSPVRPALIPQRVVGFRGEHGKTNDIEAKEIASLVMACLNDPVYKLNDFAQPTTYGVISLVGEEQALLVEYILRQHLSPDVFARHRLLCGNAAQFQGDERDVMFLSMVDGPPDDGQLRMLDAGPKDLFKKRYNVAVSRARNQLWIVHSMDMTRHLKTGDLRRRLLAHAHDPKALLREMDILGSSAGSPFEKQVMERLVSAGFRVRSQWPVGAYRIDLVVEGRNRRLAVECDGEKWHTLEQLQNDLERQAILERLGWIFVRVRGSVFFRDGDAAMAPVFAKLGDLEIEALGPASKSEEELDSPLIERIRRNAEALRAQWRSEESKSAADEAYARA